jgi:hypothetical protein
MSEYNNNVPNPDWYVRGESETLPDKEILATLDETKRRLLRDQAIGLRNLRDKRFYLEYPNNTIYDIVNTIGLIPATNGQAVRLPKTEAGVRNLPMSGAGRCWVTSLPFTIATGGGVRNHPMGSTKDAYAPRCSSAFRIIGAGAAQEITFPTNIGDTLFCIVWYSFIDSTPSDENPFEVGEDWIFSFKSDGVTSNDGTFWVNCYLKVATEENTTITITNTKDREIVVGLFDYWGYDGIPLIDKEKMIAGTGNKVSTKDSENDYLWILRSAVYNASGFIVYPDSVRKVRFFEPNRPQYEIYLDDDEAGSRTISFGNADASTGVFPIILTKDVTNEKLKEGE